MQEKNKDLVPVSEEAITPNGALQLISLETKEVDIERYVAEIEKNIELYKRIKIQALRLTKEGDWIYFGSSLYLMVSGTDELMKAYGICTFDTRSELEWLRDEAGEYYLYTIVGKAYSRKLGILVEERGSCSQRDRLFSMSHGKMRSASEIDAADIKSTAATNFRRKATTIITGTASVTEEDLKEAGLNPSKIRKISFGSRKQQPEPPKPAQRGRPPKETPPKEKPPSRPFKEDEEKETIRGQIMDFCEKYEDEKLVYAEVAHLFKKKYKREFANASLDQLLNYKDYLKQQVPEDLRKEIKGAVA